MYPLPSQLPAESSYLRPSHDFQALLEPLTMDPCTDVRGRFSSLCASEGVGTMELQESLSVPHKESGNRTPETCLRGNKSWPPCELLLQWGDVSL